MMIKLLIKLSSWKYIIPLFILVCVFVFYVFSGFQSVMNELSGEKVVILDVRFSYSINDVILFFDTLGDTGLKVYRNMIVADMMFPIVYGPLLILFICLFLKKVIKSNSKFFWLMFIPLFIMIFDYFENINTLSLINSFPNLSKQDVIWGSLMSTVKHIFTIISIGLLIALFTVNLRKTIINRQKTSIKTDK